MGHLIPPNFTLNEQQTSHHKVVPTLVDIFLLEMKASYKIETREENKALLATKQFDKTQEAEEV